MKNDYIYKHDFCNIESEQSPLNKLLLRDVRDLEDYIKFTIETNTLNGKYIKGVVKNIALTPNTRIIIERI